MNQSLFNWIGMGGMMLLATTAFCSRQDNRDAPASLSGRNIRLPAPRRDGEISLERALASRRSVRRYAERSLRLGEMSQLLWAVQGKTDDRGLRTAPSAGALYPLEVFLAAARVSGLKAGIYRYLPDEHALSKVSEGNRGEDLRRAALNQRPVAEAAAVVVIAAVYERTADRYGDRGSRFVHMEAGHAAQNLLLQAEVLGLGAVPVGSFNDKSIKDIIGGRPDELPLYLIPVGGKVP